MCHHLYLQRLIHKHAPQYQYHAVPFHIWSLMSLPFLQRPHVSTSPSQLSSQRLQVTLAVNNRHVELKEAMLVAHALDAVSVRMVR